MPLIIPPKMVDPEVLQKENIFIMDEGRASSQDIRPLRLAIVNLMPTKEETEIQLLRMLSNTALQIDIDFLATESYQPSHSDPRRLEAFYKTFEEIKHEKYDAMIITGAPVEKLKYEDILYWEELQRILDFARENVYSTLFICWAAQAAFHHYYGVNARTADKKIFGIYPYRKKVKSKLLKGFDDVFMMPQSRHTYLLAEDLAHLGDIQVLADHPATGVALAASEDNRFIFDFGHWEYDKDTLHKEYLRDLNANKLIDPPYNYYLNDDPEGEILVTWRSAANLFFSNWLNYCVYQETPFILEELEGKSVSKFGGSSLSDAGQFKKVKEIIQADKDRDVVIVSAPGKRYAGDLKITDRLINDYRLKAELHIMQRNLDQIQRELDEKKEQQQENSQEIGRRFLEIIDNIGLGDDFKEDLKADIEDFRQSTDRDFILSRGEYFNARILAEYLGYDFIDAKNLIRFDDSGQVDLEASYELIREKIKPGQKVVVPGFYGADDQGHIHTFSRGGSDFTGSILASALNSSVYENWTDVDGVMTADPARNKNAKRIAKLSYEELSQIIDGGAEVYQREALEPVQSKNIILRILNTNDPDGEGTEVSD